MQLCLYVVALALVVGCRHEQPASSETEPPTSSPTNPISTPDISTKQQVKLVPASDSARIGPLADAYNRIDPAKDGWSSEVVSDETSAQLKRLQHFIVDNALDTKQLETIVATSFSCAQLHPSEPKRVFERHDLTVVRAGKPANTTKYSGASGFSDALLAWRKPFAQTKHLRVKLKLYRIKNPDAPIWETDVAVSAIDEDCAVQISDEWHCTWTRSEGTTPRLLTIRSLSYERCESSDQSQPLLQDVTAKALRGLPFAAEQAPHGADHWRARLPRNLGLTVTGNHGMAVGDVNGDGLEDIYYCAEGGLPNRLFMRQADGSLTDISSDSGLDILDSTSSALFVDLDNDGDQDLAIVLAWNVLILENDGRGKFVTKRSIDSIGQLFSITAADYDNDSDLDLYVCAYHRSRDSNAASTMPTPMPFHDANNGASNLLLRNDGSWNFTECAKEVGLQQNNSRFSYAASWADYDNDGDVDLYVANDFGRNCLYQNNGGKFQDVAAVAGVEDMAAGMSVSWGDFNRDGRLDLYVSNMFSSAGNRITYQRQFNAAVSDEARQGLQRHARGNSLFQNIDGQKFSDVSEAQGVTHGRWAWGSKFVDLNNDGWEDILCANGFISTPDTGDL